MKKNTKEFIEAQCEKIISERHHHLGEVEDALVDHIDEQYRKIVELVSVENPAGTNEHLLAIHARMGQNQDRLMAYLDEKLPRELDRRGNAWADAFNNRLSSLPQLAQAREMIDQMRQACETVRECKRLIENVVVRLERLEKLEAGADE